MHCTDKLGRKHYITPHTGPAYVFVRAAKFYSSTSQTHVNDLLPIAQNMALEGRSALTLLVDGGPDWNTGSLLNTLSFFRLWRDADLDMLVVCSYAAKYSAYNPIEHMWSPLSKKLSGVRFSSKAGDDEKPPCQLSGLTADEKRLKEAEVFDAAIADLCSTHWKDATFDNFECSPVPVSCIDDLPLHTYSDHEDVHSFLVSSLRDIRAGKFKMEMEAMHTHVKRYRNEVIFLKCPEPGCPHCSEHPVRAKKLFKFLRERDMKMFSPVASTRFEGHYCTFMEMCDKNPEELPIGDTGMPSAANSSLGKCPCCPYFTFLSKTEKERHMKVFHPAIKLKPVKTLKVGGSFTCNYKVAGTTTCGLCFTTYYQLMKHRKLVGHQLQRNKKHTKHQSHSVKTQAIKRVRLGSDATPFGTDDTTSASSGSESVEQESEGDVSEGEASGGETNEGKARDEASSGGEEAGDGEEMSGEEGEVSRDEEEMSGEEGEMSGEEGVMSGDEEEISGEEGEMSGDEISGDEGGISGEEGEMSGDEGGISGEEGEMSGDEEDDIPCSICGHHNHPEEVINWIECTECKTWLHELCLPSSYCFTANDDDFLCPKCLST